MYYIVFVYIPITLHTGHGAKTMLLARGFRFAFLLYSLKQF